MPAVKQSRQIVAGYPTLNPRAASEPVLITADYLVPSGGLALNDVIEMIGLAEYMVPVDVKAVVEDLDTGVTLTLDCGVVTGVYGDAVTTSRTCGNEAFAASNIGQAGGVKEADKAAIYLLAPSADIIPIGLKVAAAPAGNVVGARIRLNVLAHAMPVQV